MNHQLIERMQNFTLNRKILSIDSNDRDNKKWPNHVILRLVLHKIIII